MEQQTISIAKAGLQATLNARTSILAAANPVGGRYNRKMTLRANVAMSAPIMSRFDLFFVVLDECNESVDLNIARHIINVHRFKDAAIDPEFSTEAMQRYIRYARTYQPKLTPEASDVLVEKYRQLRADDAGAGKNSYRITVRQLESMIRLSEAIARANCRQDITPGFVREAYGLLRQSIIRVEKDDIDLEGDDDEVIAEAEPAAAAGASAEAGSSSLAQAESMDASTEDGAAASTANGAQHHGAANGTAASSSATAPRRARAKLTYERYMEMMNLIVMRVRDAERATEQAMARDALVEWYLEQREGDIETMEQLAEERELTRKVLRQLVKDQFLLELRGVQPSADDDGQGDEQMQESSGGSTEHISYLVHPRVDLEELPASSAA
jgi:DNA replication licensing factor MCM6